MSTPESTSQGKVLVLIPTYNERENLPLIVGRLRAAVPTADMLIIDDGSPDGTGDIADELAAAHEGINVLHRTEKAGLGAAYIAGFRWVWTPGTTCWWRWMPTVRMRRNSCRGCSTGWVGWIW